MNGTDGMGSGPLTPQTRLVLADLSVTPEGEEFIVGDRWRGEFVSVPAIAIVILDALHAGHPLGRVATIAREHAGQEVDVLDFASSLIELGFVSNIDGVPLSGGQTRLLVDGGRLGHGVARAARPLFSRPAWILYATLFAASSAALAFAPALRPHARQLFFLHDPLTSVAILAVLGSIILCLHELAHWLAARVQGVPARITISRRLYLFVYETDLTALWALPRAKRFAPLLAGMAFHTVLLSTLLAARATAHAGLWYPSALIVRVLAAVTLIVMTELAAQFFIFLRTDLYAVFAIGLGCVNLTRTTQLTIKRTLRRLTRAEAKELAEASAREVRTALWYRWIYLTGLALAVCYFFAFFLPWILTSVRWIVTGLAKSTPTQPRFWETLLFGTVITTPVMLTLLLLARDQHFWLRRTAGLGSRSQVPSGAAALTGQSSPVAKEER